MLKAKGMLNPSHLFITCSNDPRFQELPRRTKRSILEQYLEEDVDQDEKVPDLTMGEDMEFPEETSPKGSLDESTFVD